MKTKAKKKKDKLIPVYIDLTSNSLKSEGQKKFIKEEMRQELEKDLDKRISRLKELPAIIAQTKRKKNEYVNLLREARELYVEGRFYSCVAMCGIASERIAKDILREIIIIKKLDKTNPLKFFEQLDRIPMDIVRELIIKAGVVDDSIRVAFMELARLRDKYMHARSPGTQMDARKAIKYLHEIIEGTISIFKKYKLQQGKFVPKE